MSTLTDSDVRYEVPSTVEETRSLLADSPPGTKIVAGGQSLMLLLRQGLLNPELLIDISDVPAYNTISIAADRVTIGATTTYTQLESHEVSSMFQLLGDAVSVIADSQIRNLGTIGGALGHADPALDILPPLLCLDAAVQIGGPQGMRTVPLEEFCEGYMMTDLEGDELIEAITFRRSARSGSVYEKHSNVKGGWSTVGVGATVTLSNSGDRIDEASVALAAVSDTPVRAPSVEELLGESAISKEMIARAAAAVENDIDPLDDVSGSARYKQRLAQTLTRRALTGAVERAGGERL